jgi:hypothetical protein
VLVAGAILGSDGRRKVLPLGLRGPWRERFAPCSSASLNLLTVPTSGLLHFPGSIEVFGLSKTDVSGGFDPAEGLRVEWQANARSPAPGGDAVKLPRRMVWLEIGANQRSTKLSSQQQSIRVAPPNAECRSARSAALPSNLAVFRIDLRRHYRL